MLLEFLTCTLIILVVINFTWLKPCVWLKDSLSFQMVYIQTLPLLSTHQSVSSERQTTLGLWLQRSYQE